MGGAEGEEEWRERDRWLGIIWWSKIPGMDARHGRQNRWVGGVRGWVHLDFLLFFFPSHFHFPYLSFPFLIYFPLSSHPSSYLFRGLISGVLLVANGGGMGSFFRGYLLHHIGICGLYILHVHYRGVLRLDSFCD